MKEKTLKPYQHQFSDGYTTNVLTKSYYQKNTVIFNKVREICINGDNFVPTWDSTDHFNFACSKCKSASDILRVEVYPDRGFDEVSKSGAIYFYLGCPKCGATGQRKIYLELEKRKVYCHKAIIGNTLYVYGENNEPAESCIITFEDLNK